MVLPGQLKDKRMHNHTSNAIYLDSEPYLHGVKKTNFRRKTNFVCNFELYTVYFHLNN